MQRKNSTIDWLKGLFIERLAQVMFMNKWYSERADTVYMFFIFCQLWTWQYVTLYQTSKYCEFERWYSDKYFVKIRILSRCSHFQVLRKARNHSNLCTRYLYHEYLLFWVVLTREWNVILKVPPLFTWPFLVFIPNAG